MTDDNGSTGVLILGVGVVIGLLIAYLIKTKGNTPAPQQMPYIPQYVPQYIPQQCPQCPQCPQMPAPPNIISVNPSTTCPTPAIENDEEWDIKTDARGIPVHISAHRNVRPSGG